MRSFQPRHSNLVPRPASARIPPATGCGARLARPASIDHSPVARSVLERALAGHVMLRYLGVLRVSRLGRTEERLERDEGGLEREDGRPRVLQDVKADRARRGGDVRVVDLRDKLHLDGLERVVVRDRDVLKMGIRGGEERRVKQVRQSYRFACMVVNVQLRSGLPGKVCRPGHRRPQ